MSSELEILIVEDDVGHAQLICNAFTRVGINNPITIFSDGETALDFLLSQGDGAHIELGKAYLILLDIRLPKISGVDVLARIKQDKKLRKIPIIIFTSSSEDEEINRCHDLGCSYYIAKPTKYDDFEKLVEYLGMFLTVVKVPKVGDIGE